MILWSYEDGSVEIHLVEEYNGKPSYSESM